MFMQARTLAFSPMNRKTLRRAEGYILLFRITIFGN